MIWLIFFSTKMYDKVELECYSQPQTRLLGKIGYCLMIWIGCLATYIIRKL